MVVSTLNMCSVAQSCLTLCDSLDCSPPGPSVYGTFQARTLEWVAISFSRGSSWPSDQSHVSCISWVNRQFLYHCASWEGHLENLSLILVLPLESECRGAHTICRRDPCGKECQLCVTASQLSLEAEVHEQNSESGDSSSHLQFDSNLKGQPESQLLR